MASVATTNFISSLALNTAFEAGTVSLAAYVIESPIGAAGGAIFGAVRYLSEVGLKSCGVKCLNSANPEASTDAKTLAKALEILGSFGAAWGVLAAAGYTFTLTDIAIVTLTSCFTVIITGSFVACFREA